jgi:hypothetical protein
MAMCVVPSAQLGCLVVLWFACAGVAETVERTVLAFSRPYSTCDSEDVAISDGTTRVVWAYGCK